MKIIIDTLGILAILFIIYLIMYFTMGEETEHCGCSRCNALEHPPLKKE